MVHCSEVTGGGQVDAVEAALAEPEGLEQDLYDLATEDPQAARYVIDHLDIAGARVPEALRQESRRFLDADVAVELASHSRLGKSPAQIVAAKQNALSVAGKTELLPDMHRLANGPLGLFLIGAQGLDWEHTDWLFNPNIAALITALGGSDQHYDEVLYNNGPTVLATRERFHIFQQVLCELIRDGKIRDGATLASIPNGRMRDLLTLDHGALHLRRVAIDRDPMALVGARELAHLQGIREDVDYREGDALALGIDGEFDALTSNGLNIYLTDEETVRPYEQFFRALKAGGHLVTSQITPPTEWSGVNMANAALQMRLMVQVVGAKWETRLRPVALTRAQLESVGFEVTDVRSGTSNIFPTFVARKPG